MTGKPKRRRGHNEGSIYQRADGMWAAAISLGMVDGKRRRKVVYGSTREEVRQKMVKVQNDLRRGLPVKTAGVTVAAFLEEWLAAMAPKVAPKTRDNYTMVVRTHLIPALGRHKLEKLTQRHVQAMLDGKLADEETNPDGLSPRSVVYIRNILRAALNEAIRLDLVSRNVATLVHPPRVPTYEGYALTPEEAGRLLGAVRGDRLEALYVVSLLLGLRQGETLGLRWEDVDLEAGKLTVRRQLQVIDGQPTFTEPKTKRSRRTIPLPASVREALSRHHTRQLEERLAASGRWQATWGLVFCDALGGPIRPPVLRKHFHTVLARAELPDMRWHDLRHSAASFLAARDVHPSVAQAILGHASQQTTLSVYTHAGAEAIRRATDLMGDLVSDGTGGK